MPHGTNRYHGDVVKDIFFCIARGNAPHRSDSKVTKSYRDVPEVLLIKEEDI